MFKRETVEIDRLLRKSTFEKHVTIDALKSSDKNYNVEVIKFCPSFEGFSPPASPVIHHPRLAADASIAALDFKPGEGKSLPLPPGTPPRCKINPHDIILNVPRAELVEIKPCDSGWFAIFTIDRSTKDAIDAFVAAGRRHFKENRFQAGNISPFTEPLQHEARKGAHMRLSVKISEYCGKMMQTTIFNAQDEMIFSAGHELLHLHEKPPLGPCAVSIHLMGYWYDLTKQGPLLYLTKLASFAKDVPSTPPSPLLPAGMPGWEPGRWGWTEEAPPPPTPVQPPPTPVQPPSSASSFPSPPKEGRICPPPPVQTSPLASFYKSPAQASESVEPLWKGAHDRRHTPARDRVQTLREDASQLSKDAAGELTGPGAGPKLNGSPKVNGSAVMTKGSPLAVSKGIMLPPHLAVAEDDSAQIREDGSAQHLPKLGYLPKLGLFRSPHEDLRRRRTTMMRELNHLGSLARCIVPNQAEPVSPWSLGRGLSRHSFTSGIANIPHNPDPPAGVQ